MNWYCGLVSHQYVHRDGAVACLDSAVEFNFAVFASFVPKPFFERLRLYCLSLWKGGQGEREGEN